MDELNYSSLFNLYQQLEQISTELENPPFQATLTSKLVVFTNQFLLFAKKHPDVFSAQPHLYKSQFSPEVNVMFDTLVYLSVIAGRNKLDETVLQQLLIAAICVSSSADSPQAPNNKTELKTSLLHAQLTLFAASRWKLCRRMLVVKEYALRYLHKNSNKLAKLDTLQSLLFIAVKLASLTRNNGKTAPLSFAHALKKICLDAPQHWYTLLRPLMFYPSLIPPGTTLKDQYDDLQLCLAIQSEKTIIYPLSNANDTIKQIAIRIIETAKVKQVFSVQKLPNINKLDEYWGPKFQQIKAAKSESISLWNKKTSLSSVPSSLVAIQLELNTPQPNVDKIVAILEKEQAFSTQLQHIASANSRLMLPVVSSRHGLLMNGFDRSYQSLLQHSLLSRLTQETFPLQNRLANFTQLFCFTADEISKRLASKASDLASTVCLFALSYFFISPMIRTRHMWQPIPVEHYKLSHLFALEHPEQFKQFPVKLAQAWQQPKQVIIALKQLSMGDSHIGASQICLVIGLALIASRDIYFQENASCEHTELFKQNAFKQLKFSQTLFDELLKDLALKNQVYCSLSF